MRKVYCKNCKYLIEVDDGDGYFDEMCEKDGEKYYSSGLEDERGEIGCPYYKRKWHKFWVKK